MKIRVLSVALLLMFIVSLIGCGSTDNDTKPKEKKQYIEQVPEDYIGSVNDVPEFSGEPYVKIKNNVPDFTDNELKNVAYEFYSELDDFGRCGVARACIGKEIMPTTERGEIGQIKPTGWHTVKYSIVDGQYLYNRCHLIGFQLTGENANPKNLITGTRFMNMDGMLPFENMIADYIKETDNHVIYRVTPIYDKSNLLARGVQLEAKSVEDKGEGICFNVYVYNSQPGIAINYVNGDSKISDGKPFENTDSSHNGKYVLNINTKKFHKPDCASAKKTNESNKEASNKDREVLISEGYSPCKTCNP